jgi:predicted 3-demethylubiquinone-9 3-methyltransferase (glyoxalase superfamily)
MASGISTFLMFEGRAEEAMNFYVSLFKDARVEHIVRYGAGEAGAEGSVNRAAAMFNGQRFMFFDSPVNHAFSFTPAISIFVDCESEAEIDRLFAKLSEGGQTLMPLDAYPFARKFGWTADRFGVSWQLSLV